MPLQRSERVCRCRNQRARRVSPKSRTAGAGNSGNKNATPWDGEIEFGAAGGEYRQDLPALYIAG